MSPRKLLAALTCLIILAAAPTTATAQPNAAWVALPLDGHNYGKPRVEPTRFEFLEWDEHGHRILQARRITWRNWNRATTRGRGEWRRCRAWRCSKWRTLRLQLSDLRDACAQEAIYDPRTSFPLIPAQAPLPLYHSLRLRMPADDRKPGHYLAWINQLLLPCDGPPHTHPPRDCGEINGPDDDSPRCRGDHNTPLLPRDCAGSYAPDYTYWLRCPEPSEVARGHRRDA